MRDGVRNHLATIFLLTLMIPIAAGGLRAEENSTRSIEGFWRGVQEDGVWAFVFEFIEVDPGVFSGLIHTYQNDQKVQEVPIDVIDYDGNEIRLHIKMNDVKYRGTVDLETEVIDGEFHYTNGSTLAMILTLVDPATLPALSARDAAPGGTYEYDYRAPVSVDDGWEVANLSDEGLDHATVVEMVNAIVAGDYGFLHSILIARNGRLVLEEYFYNHDRETPHRLASATKSVSSLLIGIAVDLGLLEGVEGSILSYFPEYASTAAPGWKSVNLRHILTMSAGADWAKTDLDGFYASEDRFATVFSQPIAGVPGETFKYLSPNMDLLAGVISHTSGMYADDFADRYLFGPLGITDYRWDYGRWEGHPLMDGSLALRPRDMAKIGQMVLDGGRWGGAQIVSSGWIKESTASQINTGDSEDYGYLWWRAAAPFEGRKIQGIFASGWGSQFIFIIPDYNLVVVTTGGNEDNSMNFAPLNMFADYILPATK